MSGMRTARTTYSKTGNATITLDLLDALELSEVLDYLQDWLRGAGAAVHEDLHRFAGDQQATQLIQRRLTVFSQLLVFGEVDDHSDDATDDDGDQDPCRERRW